MKKLYFSLVAFLFLVVANAQIVTIPDANFKARLISLGVDTNHDGNIQTTEALAQVNIDVTNCSISSLTGIESFTNLQYLYCSGNQLTNLNVSSFTNIQILRCANNQLTSINVSGLANLQELECSENQLTSLDVSSLTNLQELHCTYNQLQSLDLSNLIYLRKLNCHHNQLTSLNLSSLTNLLYLYCDNNQLINVNVSGLTNLQNLSCNNNLLPSLDISGLTNLGQLICYENQLSTLDVSNSINLFDLSCYNNQLTSLNVSGLTNLQNLSCNNNQLTSINVSGLINLLDFSCPNNQLTSLNLSGLTNLQNLNCSNNQLTNIGLSGLTNLLQLNCDNNQLTSIDTSILTDLRDFSCFNNQLTSLVIKNGNPQSWFTLNIGQNPNLAYICADEADITFVQSKVNQYGYSATCHVNSYCIFTPGGTFYSIHGVSKMDGNNNGCDITDPAFQNLKYNITNGTISGGLISNTSGNYSIPVQAGTHIITPLLENPTYFTASPSSVIVSFPTTATPFTQNFCIAPNGVHHDLEVVVIPINVARPGFDANYKIKYKNKGNLNENASISFNYNDAILDHVSSTIMPTTLTTGTLSWNIGTISPFQSGEITVALNVNSPMETPAVNGGDVLSYTATVNGLNTDETTIDNTFTLNQVVVNSFDPNDKTCLEGTTISTSLIGKYVHYKIRFENTGTYPAQNIVVKDMIDTTKFDISTLQMMDASHSCVTKITNPNKIEFIFENINLPFDDATNDGYVVFKIKTKPTLVVGSTISNSANIYFDYNFPIVTNTATSTFQALTNNDFDLDKNVSLSPIPTKDNLTISLQNSEKTNSVSIYNMLGQVVQTVIGSSNVINVSELKTGDYIIKITTEKGTISKKFIKE